MNEDSLFPHLDPQRLRFPDGWDQFKKRVQDAQIEILKQPITAEEAPAILDQARRFAESDRRGHPLSLLTIPNAMLLCAQAYARNDEADKAWEVLRDVRQRGGLIVGLLADPAFDSIRESDEFQELQSFAEKETNEDVYGAYLVRSPPLFPLDDLLAIPTEPAMPTASELKDKVTVVYTGPTLTPDAITVLGHAVQAGASVHAIVTEAEDAPAGVTVHIADVAPDQLVPAMTPIIWFANRNHEVVAYLRPYSGDGLATAIVNHLSSSE